MGRNLLGHMSGLGLISGFDENYFDNVRRSTIPIMIIRGTEDARTPPFRVAGLANAAAVRNFEVPGGAYVFYEAEETVLEHIDTFCGAH